MPTSPEVDAKLIWDKCKKAEQVRKVSSGDQIKPWTNLRELPEFNYKTANNYAFPPFYAYERFYEAPPEMDVPNLDTKYKYEVFKNHYRTTASDSYVRKIVQTEPGEKPSFLDYLDIVRERFQKKLFLVRENKSEYSSAFMPLASDVDTKGVYKDQTDQVSFKNSPLVKSLQPYCDPAEGGARTERDIYISQAMYAHNYFSPQKMKLSREPTMTPESGIRVYVDPNPLDPELKHPFRQLTFRKKILTVPHRGMITEFQESYQPQVDMFARSPDDLIFDDLNLKTNVELNTIKEMDKYHTEYSHINSNWGTQNI